MQGKPRSFCQAWSKAGAGTNGRLPIQGCLYFLVERRSPSFFVVQAAQGKLPYNARQYECSFAAVAFRELDLSGAHHRRPFAGQSPGLLTR